MSQQVDNIKTSYPLFRDQEYVDMLARKRDGFEETHPQDKIDEVFQWTTTQEYRELNFAREALTINPAKACQPLGAVLCALGFEKTMPYVHGSQGCVAYFRTYFNRHFKELFARLFEGGRAELRLVEAEEGGDPLDTGVELMAQPRGKRLQAVTLLSGGERALTGLALLFAIFYYRPSPFCVLDEVDAPLDDANIHRFLRVLRELTSQTQFLVITHNRKTMEAADILYGVTMEEPGLSKLVSVNLGG